MVFCGQLFKKLDQLLAEKKSLDEIGVLLCDNVDDGRGKAIRLIKVHKGEQYLIDNADWLGYNISKIREICKKKFEQKEKNKFTELGMVKILNSNLYIDLEHNIMIDKEFSEILPPLTEEEYTGLESLLIEYGCQDPLITWNGIILDGHFRYYLCKKHGIPFKTHNMEFSNRKKAMDWIISNQVGRKNLNQDEKEFLRSAKKELEVERENKRKDSK